MYYIIKKINYDKNSKFLKINKLKNVKFLFYKLNILLFCYSVNFLFLKVD